jgi:hypothetical protein
MVKVGKMMWKMMVKAKIAAGKEGGDQDPFNQSSNECR